MIELIYCLNSTFIFNVKDWAFLRKNHRIVGELTKNVNSIPSLPLKLLPEETLLLIDKKIAKVVEKIYTEPSLQDKKNFENFENEIFRQQQILYKIERKKQLESIIEKIVEGKRKNGDTRSLEEIFNEELEKSSIITKDSMIWPILLTSSNQNDKSREISIETILTSTTPLKFAVYKNLWEKGYFITEGQKFGGDFLVYLGDPLAYHAIFIIRCVENPAREINPTEIVAFGRLGTSVRKRFVLASFNEDKTVSYITINWMGS